MSQEERQYKAWFDALYRKYMRQMTVLAVRRLRDRRKAEELVHDTFELLWKKRDNIIHHPNIGGWLMKTLSFLLNNEVQSSEYRKELPLEDIMEQAEAPVTVSERLAECLPAGLTEGEQNLLIWYYDDELDYEHIAKKLNITVTNCRMRMTRARKRYRELIQHEKNSENLVTK